MIVVPREIEDKILGGNGGFKNREYLVGKRNDPWCLLPLLICLFKRNKIDRENDIGLD